MASTCRFAITTARIGLLAGLVLCPVSAAGAAAGQGAGAWTLRGFGARLDTTGDTLRFVPIDPLPPVTREELSLDDGSGVGLALEYRATRRLGIEALAIFADLDGELRLHRIDPPGPDEVVTRDVSSDLLGLGLNVHLTPGRRIDLYVGPLAAFVRYGDVRATVGGATFGVDFDDETAFGATLGADVALGDTGRWALTAALRRLWSTASLDDTNLEIDVDPLLASLGLAYRWRGP